MSEKPIIDKIKQVIVVRKDLNMRTGKFISQGSHGAVGSLSNRMKREKLPNGWIKYQMLLPPDDPLDIWLQTKFTKIVPYVNSEEELLEIHRKAEEAGIFSVLIQDAGDTEFHGVPTYTAVCLGPHYESKIDPITRHLKLL
jgi:peptidyl-tRNA hydrolase, PTH2 family